MTELDELRTIIATDCGSTTTKAILIEKVEGEYRLIARGEAPTTVEAPFEDVTVGVRNAVRELEDLTARTFLGEQGIISPRRADGAGADLYVSTSSAGGGLQMLVTGVVKSMTAESAQRAALGAGAIVMDVISVDDGRKPHEKIQRVRHLRPDMILLSGGVDGGTVTHVVELAELLAAADPRPRLGSSYRLPVIYAGNREARQHIQNTLGGKVDLRLVENLRPVLEQENLGPARAEIHNLFMEHVMAQAPGYGRLVQWAGAPIMPTPGAVGLMIQAAARRFGLSIIGVDIGGATTDVFSVLGEKQEIFNRTVSANLGMSYSIGNVLLESGLENITRWLPFAMDPADLRNRIRNKMIRPTTIPQTLTDLAVEQAIAREALRLAFEHHKTLATGLKGIRRQRTVGDMFNQTGAESLISMLDVGMLIGSGGVLSHAPRRVQSALMALDAFQPEGLTQLAVDSIFMAPQLGVLSTIHAEAATQVFERDCLVRLGTAIAPVGTAREGDDVLTVTLTLGSGERRTAACAFGTMALLPLAEGEVAEAEIKPARSMDVGLGKGAAIRTRVQGGVCGVILDCRGRPLTLPGDALLRRSRLIQWFRTLQVYPESVLDRWEGGHC